MYCPHCGQQQVSDVIRFCSRCGFPLEGVIAVLQSGGLVPMRPAPLQNRGQSPRAKGVKQGALMMLSTLPIVPLMAIFTSHFGLAPELFVPLTAVALFIGGLFRIFYALLMQDDVPEQKPDAASFSPAAGPQFERNPAMAALPPQGAKPTTSWRPRPNTAEIYQPPSVTENTTRLLDKDDSKNR
jgi:zinc-ribbon domain